LFLRNGAWNVRYYDDRGRRCQKAGFGVGREGKAAARSWLDRKVREVEALRRGDEVPSTRTIPTLDELADEYLAQHVAEANTIRTLTERLRYARSTLGAFASTGYRSPRSARGGRGFPSGPPGTSTRRYGSSCTTPSRWACSPTTRR
jgi:hypothetical protein